MANNFSFHHDLFSNFILDVLNDFIEFDDIRVLYLPTPYGDNANELAQSLLQVVKIFVLEVFVSQY